MSTVSRTGIRNVSSELPPLHNGDRLTQPEFHRRYEGYPEDVKFELKGRLSESRRAGIPGRVR
jgi:hypothetical protein